MFKIERIRWAHLFCITSYIEKKDATTIEEDLDHHADFFVKPKTLLQRRECENFIPIKPGSVPTSIYHSLRLLPNMLRT